MHADTSGYAIHLGDGAYDFLAIARFIRISVSPLLPETVIGRLVRRAPTELLLSIDNFRLSLCHGHKYGVKFGTARLIKYAADAGADIALFGTHIRRMKRSYLMREVGVLLGFLITAVAGSFGLIEIKDGSMLMSHGVI